jgi:glycogen(starch) synthase
VHNRSGSRILVWADHAFPRIGGVELMMRRLLPDLRARGHDIAVIAATSRDAPTDDEQDGIVIHRLELPLTSDGRSFDVVVTNMARAKQIAQSFCPDLMLLMQPVAMLVYYFGVASQRPVRSIYALRSGYDWVLEPHGMSGRAIAASDFVIACSDTLLAAARASIPSIASRSIAILTALPMPGAEPAPLPWTPPRFLCLGQIQPHKGFDTALRAFARLVKLRPDARLTIAGYGASLGDLRQLAVTLGLDARVEFPGWIAPEAVPDALNAATVVLIPSLVEGFPQVAIQAAQMGRPVIATRAGGLPEIVLDGQTGLLVEPGDAAALADAMLRTIENPAGTAALGRAALARGAALSDWGHHVSQLDAVIRSQH